MNFRNHLNCFRINLLLPTIIFINTNRSVCKCVYYSQKVLFMDKTRSPKTQELLRRYINALKTVIIPLKCSPKRGPTDVPDEGDQRKGKEAPFASGRLPSRSLRVIGGTNLFGSAKYIPSGLPYPKEKFVRYRHQKGPY